MKRTRILAAVLTVCLLSGNVLAEEWAKLKGRCGLFALDPNTGAALGIEIETASATLYPKDYIDGKNQDVVGPVGTAAGAQDVLFKQYKDKGYFVISFQDSTQILVLDSKTLKTVKQITLREVVRDTIASGTDPDDPYVYCAGGWSSSTACFSMETMQWVCQPGGEGTEIAVSADGNYLYARSLDVSPSGFDCWAKAVDDQTGKVRWIRVFDEHDTVPGYLPGPFGRYCAVGSSMYSVDLRQKLAELEFLPMCFFRKHPVIVGISEGQLVAASYNTLKTFSTKELPGGFLAVENDEKQAKIIRRRKRRYSRYGSYGAVTFMPDDANKRVVLAYEDRMLIRTFEEMSVADEPLLVCDVKGPRHLLTGRQAVLAVTPIDQRSTVRLEQGPAGMELAGSKLTWTPSAGQVGPVKAVLQITAGQTSVSQSVDMVVTHPNVNLPFVPEGLSVSPDGSRAVVWRGREAGREYYERRADQPTKMAMIDLTKMKVVLEKTLPYTVATAAVDANFVYVSPYGADRINALDLKGMSRKNYVLTESGVDDFIAVASKRLVAQTEEYGGRVFEVPSLKAVEFPGIMMSADECYDYDVLPMSFRRMLGMRGNMVQIVGIYDGERVHHSIAPVGENWFAAGSVFDANLTEAKMFVEVGGMATLGQEEDRAPIVPLLWNRAIVDSTLVGQTGQRIFSFEEAPITILRAVPAAAILNVTFSSDDSYEYQPKKSAVLHLRELVSGKLVEKVPLISSVPVDRDEYDEETPNATVLGSGRNVIALVDDKLFVHAIGAKTLEQLHPPFGFVPHEEIQMIDLSKPTVISSKTIGGAAPIEFEMLDAPRGTEIDTKTGAVTVNGPMLAAAAVARLMSHMAEEIESVEAAEQTLKQLIATAARDGKARFKLYSPRKIEGIPVLVPIRVAATDKHQQVASMQFQAVIDLPQDMLHKAIAAGIAVAEQERKEAEKLEAEQERRYRQEMERRGAAYEASAKARPQGPSAEEIRQLREQIEKLDDKINKLQGQMELLMKVMMKEPKE